MATKKDAVVEQVDSVKKRLEDFTGDKAKGIKFVKNLYEDFKGTLTEVLGDTGEFISKHKILLFIAFIAYLIYVNKQFSIEKFVNKLEGRLKEDRSWGD